MGPSANYGTREIMNVVALAAMVFAGYAGYAGLPWWFASGLGAASGIGTAYITQVGRPAGLPAYLLTALTQALLASVICTAIYFFALWLATRATT